MPVADLKDEILRLAQQPVGPEPLMPPTDRPKLGEPTDTDALKTEILRMAAAPEPRGAVRRFAAGAGQALLGMPGQVAEGVGIATGSEGLAQFGQSIQPTPDGVLPYVQPGEEGVAANAGQAIGSGLAFAPMAALGGIPGALLVSGSAAAQAIPDAFYGAKAGGADDDTAWKAALVSGIGQGALETVLGPERLIGKIAGAMAKADRATGGLGRELLTSAAGEGVEEASQSLWADMVAQDLYKVEPDEDWATRLSKASEQAAYGALGGGVLGSVALAAERYARGEGLPLPAIKDAPTPYADKPDRTPPVYDPIERDLTPDEESALEKWKADRGASRVDVVERPDMTEATELARKAGLDVLFVDDDGKGAKEGVTFDRRTALVPANADPATVGLAIATHEGVHGMPKSAREALRSALAGAEATKGPLEQAGKDYADRAEKEGVKLSKADLEEEATADLVAALAPVAQRVMRNPARAVALMNDKPGVMVKILDFVRKHTGKTTHAEMVAKELDALAEVQSSLAKGMTGRQRVQAAGKIVEAFSKIDVAMKQPVKVKAKIAPHPHPIGPDLAPYDEEVGPQPAYDAPVGPMGGAMNTERGMVAVPNSDRTRPRGTAGEAARQALNERRNARGERSRAMSQRVSDANQPYRPGAIQLGDRQSMDDYRQLSTEELAKRSQRASEDEVRETDLALREAGFTDRERRNYAKARSRARMAQRAFDMSRTDAEASAARSELLDASHKLERYEDRLSDAQRARLRSTPDPEVYDRAIEARKAGLEAKYSDLPEGSARLEELQQEEQRGMDRAVPSVRYSLAQRDEVDVPALETEAKAYEAENGILPYTPSDDRDVAVEPVRYSIKQVPKDEEPHYPTGLPLNANGTVTLYFETSNKVAREIARTKRIPAGDNNRIYLSNESNPGNIEGGRANVLVHVDPALLHLDKVHENGRRDFFIPTAEGKSFFDKMKQTKLFTLKKSRRSPISADRTLSGVREEISTGLAEYLALDAKGRKKRLAQARDVLREYHNVGTLINENGKLQKTRVGDYGLTYDGKSVASMGLGLAQAQRINNKNLTTCPQSASCEGLCLGETSGGNALYGGEGAFRSGPRMAQYLKTEALILHPAEFAIVLHKEIEDFEAWAKSSKGFEETEDGKKTPKQIYAPSIRLNVTSDFPPSFWKSMIDAFPDVMFYDYTKLNSSVVAPNHHLTYSSTGASQIVDGVEVFNPNSNWDDRVKKLEQGKNVAMAFSSRTSMPKRVVDEASGQTYEVWNGDNYDARYLDPKRDDGKGWIIGLTNKDDKSQRQDKVPEGTQRTKAFNDARRERLDREATTKNAGFFVYYDPKVHGDTVTIPDQAKIAKEHTATDDGPRYSLASDAGADGDVEAARKAWKEQGTESPWFKRWFRESWAVDRSLKPIRLFHATRNAGFNEFSKEKLGSYTGAQSAKKAFFFSDSPSVAETYTDGAHEVSARDRSTIPGAMGVPASVEYRLPQAEAALERAREATYETGPADGGFEVRITEIDQYGSEYSYDDGFIYETKVEAEDAGSDAIDALIAKAQAQVKKYEDRAALEREEASAGSGTMPVYLSVQNPLVHDARGGGYGDFSFTELLDDAIADGHDGVVILNVRDAAIGDEQSDIYAVFEPAQIKSATGNRGTFSPANPDIRYSLKSDIESVISDVSEPEGYQHAVASEELPARLVAKYVAQMNPTQRKGVEEMMADADAILADRSAREKLVRRALNQEPLNEAEQIALDRIASLKATNAWRQGASMDNAVEARAAFRMARSASGRILGNPALRDALQTPAERAMALALTPSKQVARALKKAKTWQARRAIIEEEARKIERIRYSLAEKGFDPALIPDDYFKDPTFRNVWAESVADAKANGKWDWYIQWRRAAMLSGPITTIRNVTGNTSYVTYDRVARLWADALIPGTGTTVEDAREYTRDLFASLAQGWADARAAYSDFYHSSTDGTSLDEHATMRRGGLAGKALIGLEAVGIRAQAAQDIFFRTVVGHAETRLRARQKARAEGGSVEDYMTDPDVLAMSKEDMERALFLDRDGLTRAITGARDWADANMGVPVGTTIVPFAATPIKLVQRGGETLMGPIGGYMRDREKWGGALLGAGAWAAMVWAASMFDDDDGLPLITGSRERGGQGDFQDRTAPAYSIRIGDTYYSYQQIEPLSTALAAIADGIQSGDPMKSVSSFAKAAKDKSFFKSIETVYDAVVGSSNGERGMDRAKGAARDLLWTPMIPNILRSPLRATEDERTKEIGDRLEGQDFLNAAVPTGDFAPPLRYDLWGRPASKDAASWVARVLAPMQGTKEVEDVEKIDLLLAAYNRKQETDKFFSAPQVYVERNNVRRDWTEDEYSELTRDAGARALTILRPWAANKTELTERDVKHIEEVLSKTRARKVAEILRR